MKQRTPKNTRRYRRMTVRLLVDYQAKGRLYCDYATTLGAGGMLLQSELDLKRGDSVKVRFRLPDGVELFELEARVTWVHAASRNEGDHVGVPGIGLQFVDVSATAGLARELEDYSFD